MNRRQLLATAGAGALAAGLPAGMPAHATGRPATPTRGINISRWLDGPQADTHLPSLKMLDELRGAGFENIRLPLTPSPLARGGAEAGAMQARLAEALNMLRRAGFSVTVDMHPGRRFREHLAADPAHDADIETAWTHAAEALADTSPERVYPELLNEPALGRDRWLPLRNRLAERVREICQRHTIIWGANRYQSPNETLGFPPLADSNAIAAVHYYSPMVFTHQCVSWTGDGPLKSLRDVNFPVNRDAAKLERLRAGLKKDEHLESLSMLDRETGDPTTPQSIDATMRRLSQWSQQAGQPVIVNEFGVLQHCAPRKDRLAWLEAVRAACERHGLGWAHWELELGFGITAGDGTRLDMELVRRLIPSEAL